MKKWIHAARLRTLPLSLSGILMGTFLAVSDGFFSLQLFLLACITTLLLQILSNYANDYGDGVKGTDANRTGEKRAVASGEISAVKMKKIVILFSVLSFLSAVGLLALAYLWGYPILFGIYLALGVFAVWAAIQYTVGKKAYGYKGWGDLYVFIFFGLVAVIGTYMLYSKEFNIWTLLPTVGIGLLSVAVLNLNNMRDIKVDKEAGKITRVVKMGFEKAKKYHAVLLITPFILGEIYAYFKELQFVNIMLLVWGFLALQLLQKVNRTTSPDKLDSELKKTAFLTLGYALTFGLGLLSVL